MSKYNDYTNLATGKMAPDFALKSLEGNDVSLKDFKGIVIFEFTKLLQSCANPEAIDRFCRTPGVT